jgi:hypothetical protein
VRFAARPLGADTDEILDELENLEHQDRDPR